MSVNFSKGLPKNKYLPGLGTWEFDVINASTGLTTVTGAPHFLTGIDISAGSIIELIKWGDINYQPTISINYDIGGVFEFNTYIAAPSFISSLIGNNQVLYAPNFAPGYTVFTGTANFTYDGNKLTLGGATTAANGLRLGSDVDIHRSATDTLRINDKQHLTPPTNTATSGSFQGLLCQVNSAPSASSTSRNWGLQFAVAATNAQNHTDGNAGLTGFEGYARNESTGTVTREVGGLVYCDNQGAGTVSSSIVYHGFNSVTNASAVTADATVFRASAGTATGTTTAWYGFRGDAPALTANGQTRIVLRIGATPAIGAFTGTTVFAINIEGTTRLPQDGIRIAADTNLYSSAADTLKTDDSFHVGANFRHLGTNLGFYNVAQIARPTTASAAATFVANTSGIANDTATFDGYTIGQIVKALRDVGLLT